jgi:hypothetical protein
MVSKNEATRLNDDQLTQPIGRSNCYFPSITGQKNSPREANTLCGFPSHGVFLFIETQNTASVPDQLLAKKFDGKAVLKSSHPLVAK